MDLVTDFTLVLVAALAGGFLAQRLGQPLIVGYIVAGVAVGPFTGGLTVVNVHDIEQLAEVGVALLLFSLGLEVSFRELAPVRTVALAGGTIQIVLTIGLGLGLSSGFGWSWRSGLWFGSLIALSSTMVALKTIQAQGRLGTLSSRVMLGMLVVQDLAVVPLMIVLPELSTQNANMIRVVVATIRSLAVLAVIVLVSTRVVPRVLAAIAKWNSRELFLLCTAALALGIGYTTWWLGLSLAIGAFIAGLVVNESDYAHQALSDIAPLRDLFGMLFFVSIGMLLDPVLVRDQIGPLAVTILSVVVGKALIFAGVVRLFGYYRIVPVAVGLTLFQVGEFAFVLARAGRSAGAISEEVYAVALNTAIATMAITPVLAGLAPALYKFAGRRRESEPLASANLPRDGLSGHVVICGAGRVGQAVARALESLRLRYVLIDFDDSRMQQARTAGLPVIYGDATQRVVLEAARVNAAAAVVITTPALLDARRIVGTLRELGLTVPTIARAETAEAMTVLNDLGISEVTSPQFEAAIAMTQRALAHLNVPAEAVTEAATAIRSANPKNG